MGFLDDLIGYRDVLNGLTLMPRRKILRFDGFTVVDDPLNSATLISGGGGGGSPGGGNESLQFNDGGAFGGGADLLWDKVTRTLAIGNPAGAIVSLAGDAFNAPLSVANAGGDLVATLGLDTTSGPNGAAADLVVGDRDPNGLVASPRGSLYMQGGASSGLWLNTDNATAWASLGSGLPGSANTTVQFNDGGVFGGDPAFTWDKAAALLSVTGRLRAISSPSFPVIEIFQNNGDAGACIDIDSTGGVSGIKSDIHAGNRDPNGLIAGTEGSLYIRGDGASSTVYVNVDGVTAWRSLGASASAILVVDSSIPPGGGVYASIEDALVAKASIPGVVEIQVVDLAPVVTGANDWSRTRIVAGIPAGGTQIDLGTSTGIGSPPLYWGAGVSVTRNAATVCWTLPPGVTSMNAFGSGFDALGTGATFLAPTGAVFRVHGEAATWLAGPVIVTSGTGNAEILQASGSMEMYDFGGVPAGHSIFLSDAAIAPVSAGTGERRRVTDSYLNASVNFSGPVFENLLAHVGTLSGAYTATLPDPSAGNVWHQGQTSLIVDADGNARLNPITIAGPVNDLPGYSLNKADDVALLIPSNIFNSSRFNVITAWPRFEGEFVADIGGGSNAFLDVDAAINVASGYPGVRTLRIASAMSTADAIFWEDFVLAGTGPGGVVLTFSAGASWNSSPNEIEDLSVLIESAGIYGPASGRFPRLNRATLSSAGLTAAAFVHNSALTVEMHFTDSTLVGDAADGLFLVNASGADLVVHLWGECNVGATAFERGIAGDVRLVVHDVGTVIAPQTLIPSANLTIETPYQNAQFVLAGEVFA